jgi:hypothetical protein
VNTEAPFPDADAAWWRIQKIQTKLQQWATDDPDRRFGDLGAWFMTRLSWLMPGTGCGAIEGVARRASMASLPSTFPSSGANRPSSPSCETNSKSGGSNPFPCGK